VLGKTRPKGPFEYGTSLAFTTDMTRALIVSWVIVLAAVAPVCAAAADAESVFVTGTIAAPPVAADMSWFNAPARPAAEERGAMLPALYAGLASLNAYDAYTTSRAVSAGVATEANPLLHGAVHNSLALWAIKGGVTAGSIVLAEHLWRTHHRAQAVAMMVVSNGVMAAVAARNTSVLRAR
jgi:hypothetical protein